MAYIWAILLHFISSCITLVGQPLAVSRIPVRYVIVSKHWYSNDRFSSADKQHDSSLHYFVRSYCFSKFVQTPQVLCE